MPWSYPRSVMGWLRLWRNSFQGNAEQKGHSSLEGVPTPGMRTILVIWVSNCLHISTYFHGTEIMKDRICGRCEGSGTLTGLLPGHHCSYEGVGTGSATSLGRLLATVLRIRMTLVGGMWCFKDGEVHNSPSVPYTAVMPSQSTLALWGCR